MAEFEIDPRLRSMLIDTQAQVHVLQMAAMSALMTLIKRCPPDLRASFVNDIEANMSRHNLPEDVTDPVELQYYIDLSVATEAAAKDFAAFLRMQVAALHTSKPGPPQG